MNDEINVLYSSDDNYAQHMGVSIYSLLHKNQKVGKINFYVIDNDISVKNKEKIIQLVKMFPNRNISFTDFERWRDQLNLNMSWDISISSYARLFVESMLPETVNKVLYIDCDMIICGDIRELWNIDLTDKLIGAVQDSINEETKNAVGIQKNEKYFNAGMLLINLKRWREQGIEKKCLNFINDHEGNVRHHDQGVLNGVCGKQTLFLPLKYNVMTIHYMFERNSILNYFKEEAEFYSESEIKEAKNNPVILHYTPSFTSRPWIRGCKHPLKDLYWEILDQTPWRGNEPQKNTLRWYIRLIDWKHRILRR